MTLKPKRHQALLFCHCLLVRGDTMRLAWLPSQLAKPNTYLAVDGQPSDWLIAKAGQACVAHAMDVHEDLQSRLPIAGIPSCIPCANRHALLTEDLPVIQHGVSRAGTQNFGQVVYRFASAAACANFGTAELHAFFLNRSLKS